MQAKQDQVQEQAQKYTLKMERFEGPLELLLDLIEKRKLLINDISLSKVADDFIQYVNALTASSGQFPIAESAQFIVIASTLLLIKSKSLLPTLDLTDEEQLSVAELERRLALYKRFRELGSHIKNRFGKRIIFEKMPSKNIEPIFSPDPAMTMPALLEAIKGVINNFPRKEFIPQAIVKKVISLEEMIATLTERIKASLKLSFKEFAGVGKEEKVNVIVSFLAMLELVKQGIVNVTQEREFDDINIETQNIGVPRY